MSQTPTTTTTQRARPKLVIFDDKGKILKAFVEKFEALGYDVTGVYVSDGNYDNVMKDGRFKRGVDTVPVDDWREQDKQLTPERTLDSAYAEAVDRVSNGNRRYQLPKDMYEGMLALNENTRAISSPEQVRAILEELKPDCVLSDLQMRELGEHSVTNPLMGTDVMRIAAEACPTSIRALHSSLYTFYDDADFRDQMETTFGDEYEQALKDAADGGYLLSSKDYSAMEKDDHSRTLDQYFRKSLNAGAPLRITMGPEAANAR